MAVEKYSIYGRAIDYIKKNKRVLLAPETKIIILVSLLSLHTYHETLKMHIGIQERFGYSKIALFKKYIFVSVAAKSFFSQKDILLFYGASYVFHTVLTQLSLGLLASLYAQYKMDHQKCFEFENWKKLVVGTKWSYSFQKII